MAGVLACELGNSDKLAHFIGECVEMEISVLGPDVNESGENFTPVTEKVGQSGSIRFGLSAVKGVGDVAGKKIVEERETGGVYKSFGDLVERVDGKAINKRVLECLVKSGGFDALEENRALLLADLDRAMGEAQLRRKDREAGQTNLFEMMGGMKTIPMEPLMISLPLLIFPMSRRWKNWKSSSWKRNYLGSFFPDTPLILWADWVRGWIRLSPKNWMNYKAGDLFAYVEFYLMWKEDIPKRMRNLGLVSI